MQTNSLVKFLDIKNIESSGGIVTNKDYHVLLIFKRGKWDLPKGRVEKKQDIIKTAIREVHEESGLKESKLKVHCEMPPTFHTTFHGKKRYLKKLIGFG